jgi:hypothetical protein
MSFKDLYRISPPELKQIVIDQWKAKQNPTHHPEGNTLKHIIVVTNRAFRDFPDNKDIQLAAYFHDLGKLATYDINPKTGQPTAYGHEVESSKLIDEFSSFIKQQGANPEIVKYIVANHMKIKPSTWDVMKPAKKDPIINDPSYQDLEKFGTIDKGGLLESIYLYSNNKKNKMAQLINEAKRMQLLAGLITESQFNEAEENVTPEQATQKVMAYASKIENSPELDKLAQKIVNDPKLMDQLQQALAKGGVQANLNEDEGGLDNQDMKTLMINFAKKGKQIQERISNDLDSDTSSAGLGMASVVVGGVIGGALKTAILAAVPAAASLFAGPALVGAAIGLGLFLLARKIYLMNNPNA